MYRRGVEVGSKQARAMQCEEGHVGVNTGLHGAQRRVPDPGEAQEGHWRESLQRRWQPRSVDRLSRNYLEGEGR